MQMNLEQQPIIYHIIICKNRDLQEADKYADIAMQYDETAQSAAEVKAQCMHDKMKNAEDSIRYLSVLQQLYRTEPTNEKYFFVDHEVLSESYTQV